MEEKTRRSLLGAAILGICFSLILFVFGRKHRHHHHHHHQPFRVRAVNLGGWLVFEGWMKPSLITNIPNSNLLDGTFFQLKSIKAGKYICRDENGRGFVLAGQPRPPNTLFRLWRSNATHFQFRLNDKKFVGLSSDRNATTSYMVVPVSKVLPGFSETFQIFKLSDHSNQLRIKASNGFFLQVNEEGYMTADFDIGNGDRDGGDPSVFEMQIERKLDGEFQVTNGYGPLAPKVMKEHWNTFITEDDFKFMSSNGINTVRIPVGWWIASDPNPPPPYVGGSLQVLDKAFSWAQKYEMKVIVDLHAAPGSQTATTVSSSRDGFMEWGQTEKNIEDTVAIIDFLTARYAKHPSLYAVELLNEPLLPAVPLETLLRYYRAGYEAVRRHSSEAYVLFSNRLGFDPSNPIELLPLATELRGSVIDVHYYHCFMGIFKNMTLQQNIDFLYANSSVELNQLTESGALVFVGEWATEWATGNFQNPNGTTATKEEYQRFGKAELEVYGRASFGWAYWALRSAHPHFSLEWMINNGYVKLT